MRVAAQELAHLIVQRRGLGHEIGLHGDIRHLESRQRLRGGLRPTGQLVHGAQQVLGVDHPDDVFGVVFEDRQTGIGAVEGLIENGIGISIGIDQLDPGAVEHDLLNRALAQIQCAQKAVPVFLFHYSFRVAQSQRPDDFLADREHVLASLNPHAEGAQNSPYNEPDNGHKRGEHSDHKADHRGRAGGGCLGRGDGKGFRQHFCEDQHEQGHHKSGEGHATVTKGLGCGGCRQRGAEDVCKVVAEQNAPDQPLIIFLERQRRGSTALFLVGHGAQFAA